MYQDYLKLIESKRHLGNSFGFDPVYMPDMAFPFQKYGIEKAITKGRFANLYDTGLGKTLIQLAIAQNVVMHTNKKVLITTPLAVAFQFLDMAAKMDIGDIEYSKDGKHKSKIVICNYERLHYFDKNDFVCVMVDESGILKNSEGFTRNTIIDFMRKMPYRYLSTATPSPNDYTELGNSSEALGYMGYTDVLTRFFKNNQDSVDTRSSDGDYYLKPHAEKDFWAFIATWGICVRMPSDIGFSDEGYVLPPLHQNLHIIRNETPLVVNGQGTLFALPAVRHDEVRSEGKVTIEKRCEKAVDLAAAHETSVYWVNLDPEAECILSLDRNAIEINGRMSIEKKEEILIAFAKGQISKLITKPKITAFGLNWQHCGHTTYFPDYSYEKYYQALRRFLRFGRVGDVVADIIISDGQERMYNKMISKKEKADRMHEEMAKSVNSIYTHKQKEFDKPIIKPNFI